MLQIYSNIKLRRKELHLTQQALADLTGYSDKSAISRIENGDIDIPQSKILAFAEALKISPSELMGSDGIDETEITALDKLYELNEIQKSQVLIDLQMLNKDNQERVMTYCKKLLELQRMEEQ